MAVATGVRAGKAIGARPRVTAVIPPPDEGEWPNGYKHRMDFQIDAGMISASTTDQLIMVRSTLSVLTENDGLDVQFVVGEANVPSMLIKHDAGETWHRVRIPAVSSAADTAMSMFTGQAGMNNSNPAGVYAGFTLAINGLTGADMTGQGRDHTPDGVTAGVMEDGQPAGVYDGADITSRTGVTNFLAGLPSVSVYCDLQCDAAADGDTRPVYVQSSATNGTSGTLDTLKLTRLAQSSNNVANCWNAVVRTSEGGVAYAHGTAGSANDDPQIVGFSWAGETPILYVDGLVAPTSATNARGGTIQKLSDGSHLGALLQAKIAELLIHPTALSAPWWRIDALSKQAPLALWGRTQPYGPEDILPCLAMPVRVGAVAGVAQDIDVLASAIGSGLVIAGAEQGTRGTVSIVAGKARYTATGTNAGSDFFEFTVEDENGAQSTGRVGINIAASGEPEPKPEPEPEPDPGSGPSYGVELPTPTADPPTVTVTTQAQLSTAVGAQKKGQHIIVDMTTCVLPPITQSGTIAEPCVIRAKTNQGTRITGANGWTASAVRLWGFAGSDANDNNIQAFPGTTGNDNWLIRCRLRATWRNSGNRGRTWYCDIKIPNNANRRGIELVSGVNKHMHTYRCYFHDSHNIDTGSASGVLEEMLQCGFGNTQRLSEKWNVHEECLFENCGNGSRQSETLGIKNARTSVIGCTMVNSRFINSRNGPFHEIDRCWIEGTMGGARTDCGIRLGDMQPRLRNTKVVGTNVSIEIKSGTHSYTLTNSNQWPGSAHFNAFEAQIYNLDLSDAPNNTLKIGVGDGDLKAINTVIRGLVGGPAKVQLGKHQGTSASNTWANAAPAPYATPNWPVKLTPSDVGLFAT